MSFLMIYKKSNKIKEFLQTLCWEKFLDSKFGLSKTNFDDYKDFIIGKIFKYPQIFEVI